MNMDSANECVSGCAR